MTEIMCLTFALYYEAGNQNLIGKVAVAQNIMYRVKDKYYPNTVCGVVTEYKQYSFYYDGKPEKQPSGNKLEEKSWQEAKNVANAFLAEGADGSHFVDIIDGALHYHADYVLPTWAKGSYVRIGNHLFYKNILERKGQ